MASETVRNNCSVESCFGEYRGKHDTDDPVFLVDDVIALMEAY